MSPFRNARDDFCIIKKRLEKTSQIPILRAIYNVSIFSANHVEESKKALIYQDSCGRKGTRTPDFFCVREAL
jgi:hypothetical protein